MSDDITDLTRGVYRRLYAGFLRGQRINSVSLTAEAWFWRVHAAADDFGNLDAEPLLLHQATAGRRAGEVSAGKAATLVGELVTAGLLRKYTVNGEEFLHIDGFVARQPAGKNGKRVRRVPASPWDDEEQYGGIPVNPGESSASEDQDHSDYQDHSENKPAAQASAASGKRTAAAPPPDTSPVVLEFPTVAGRKNKDATWQLREQCVSDLAEAFAGIDVPAECRKALEWVRAKPGNRKTASGMRDFLRRWMASTQDRGRGQASAQNHDDPKTFAARADQARRAREAAHAGN